MSEANFARASSEDPSPASEPSTSKPRRKRKWDQADESLVCAGAVASVLPMSSVGCPVVPIPGAVSVSGALLANSLKASYANGSKEIQTTLMPRVAAVVQKLIQPKIQEDLMIAREIVINDADPAIRYKLTKRQTQEEIQQCTGAVVITRGKYRPPNAVPDAEKPLYLHISAGAHFKETTERIFAVDRAAAMVEEMLKQVSKPLSTCVYLGFDADPSLNIAVRIRGPNDQYINHITNETGATVLLRGHGSGHLGSTQGEEGQQPLHLFLSSNNPKNLEDARLLAENLFDTISRECGATRVPSCKVYTAVPPPQELLIGVHSLTSETTSDHSSGATSVCSSATSVIASPVSPVGSPIISTVLPHRGHYPSTSTQSNGFPCSQPMSIGCTSYNGYAGIYPQAMPLQGVAQALQQSVPFTSTAAPATPTPSIVSKSSLEAVKRPPQRRKFQESPAALKGSPVSQQGSGNNNSHRYSLSAGEENDRDTAVLPTRKSDSPPSNGAPPSRKSMLPLSYPQIISSMPPPVLRSMPPPPPPPKFTSSITLSRTSEKDSISEKSNATNTTVPVVPDTLVKLMEYGDGDDDDDDDDDTEENEQGTLKSNPNRIAASKPFWAV